MTRRNKMTKDNDQSDNRKKDAERQKEGKVIMVEVDNTH